MGDLVGGSIIGTDEGLGSCAQICALCRNLLFMSTTFGLCCLFFVMTGVQFWVSKFFEVCFDKPAALVETLFIVVASSAPVAGVIGGGAIADRLTNGGAIEPTARLAFLWSVFAVMAGIAAA